MMRGMFAAISGLKQHQVMLDVTANDISNVNTIGYKSARASPSRTAEPAAARRGRRQRQHGRLERFSGRPRRRSRLDRQPDVRRRPSRRPATRSTSRSRARASSRSPTGKPTAANSPLTPTRYTRAGNFSINSRGLPDHRRPASTSSATSWTRTRTSRSTPKSRSRSRPAPPASRSTRHGRRVLTSTRQHGQRASPRYRLTLATFSNAVRPRAHRRQPVDDLGQLRPEDRQHAGPGRRRRHDRAARSRCPTWTSSQTFTNMITAQRGFQANSRVISTADEMLQDLVNLKR